MPDAVIFDLDGVLTDTAAVHMAAWKEMFDAFLQDRGGAPFTAEDYEQYVDGKPRLDGTRGFLVSRGITLPDGDPADGPDAETVVGLATDYCVKHTALEALQAGFAVTVDTTAVRGVDREPGESERAPEQIRAAGAGLA